MVSYIIDKVLRPAKRSPRRQRRKLLFLRSHTPQTNATNYSCSYETIPPIYRAALNEESCLSVCLSNVSIVTKQKKDLPRFLYHTKEHLA